MIRVHLPPFAGRALASRFDLLGNLSIAPLFAVHTNNRLRSPAHRASLKSATPYWGSPRQTEGRHGLRKGAVSDASVSWDNHSWLRISI